MQIAAVVVRVNDLKHSYCCGCLLQCIFAMFASLCDGLSVSLNNASILSFDPIT